MRDASWAELAPRPSSAQAWLLGAHWLIARLAAMAQEKGCKDRSSFRKKTQADRQRSILSAGAGASTRMRMRGALAPHPPAGCPPFHPGNRGSAAERARGLGADGRDLCGTGRRGRRPRLASLKGSSGFSLSSGDRFDPEGLGPRHGLAESKPGAQRRAERVGGARRAGRRRARPGLGPTRPDPTPPDLSARRERWPHPGPRTTPFLLLAPGGDCGEENREPHPGPRRPLRALGPFLPAARAACSEGGSLLGWSEDQGSASRGGIPACAEAGVFFFHRVFSKVSAL